MTERAVRLPDVGEGVAEAELVEWLVKVGDHVREEQPLAVVMSDKASIEVPTPIAGEIVWLAGEPGQKLATGSDLVRLRLADGRPESEPDARSHPAPMPAAPGLAGQRPLASPSVRRHAREAGVDLRRVVGSGPGGRITHADLERRFGSRLRAADRAAAPAAGAAVDEVPAVADTVEEIPVIGLRRRIAEKMRIAHERIADLTYVEEVDVSELERLRAKLNEQNKDSVRPHLTVLPFLMRAMAIAVAAQPRLNAHFDDEAGVLRRYDAIHLGVATRTAAGLVVPVVRHAGARDLWSCAAELARISQAARDGTATRAELSGSTITLTSLGPLGGLMSTPIINHPEVAIVGVNRIAIRPQWDGQAFVPRRMMNLSCTFDHRLVDGWDAATFVQRLRTLIETPALLFVDR